MKKCKGGSPNLGLVPIVFDGISLLCAWVRNCEIMCVEPKKKLSELTGPLAGLVFCARSAEGDFEKDVCLKLIGKVWTVSVILFHWPKGAPVPNTLNFPMLTFNGVARSGAGGFVLWSDGSRQKIKRFAMTQTTRTDEMLWKHLKRLNETCLSLKCSVAEELDGGSAEAKARTGAGGEGASRAALAAEQAARKGGGVDSEGGESGTTKSVKDTKRKRGAEDGAGRKTAIGGKKIKIVQDGVALEYDGHFYEIRGKIRWEAIRKLIEADGEYVEFDRGFKSLFAHSKGATAFFDAAVEAEGQGRNGTHRYRLKK